MIDKEKVIKALEDAYVTDGVIKMSIQVRDVLVAMLKEQDDKDINVPIKIVRCKDCKHGQFIEGRIWCNKYVASDLVNPDWFCADGKRR